MTGQVTIHAAGPALSIQDCGRFGHIASGLSRSGAIDQLALAEANVLLAQPKNFAALEMAGFGGEFSVNQDTRIALTGAPMRASIDDTPLSWNASYLLSAGSRLKIRAPIEGTYGYLSFGGGLDATTFLSSQSNHFAAGIGTKIEQGQNLTINNDANDIVGQKIDALHRFGGGEIRVVRSMQTEFFSEHDICRFQDTRFCKDLRSNRMGMGLNFEGDAFSTKSALSIVSEVVVPGDIQITGNGMPFVLLNECQTTGGYPRIGTVIPSDFAKAAQAGPENELTFKFIELEEAVAIERMNRNALAELNGKVSAVLRDPRNIANLLSYQLISGVTSGTELEGK